MINEIFQIIKSKDSHQDMIKDLSLYVGKVDFNQTLNGQHLLFEAVKSVHSNVVDFLLKQGLNLQTINQQGENALFMASSEHMCKLLIERGINTSIKNNDGLTALLFFILNKKDALVEVMLTYARKSINIQDKNGRTALHHAILLDNSKLFEKLILLGGDPNIKDGVGFSVYKLSGVVTNPFYLKYLKNLKESVDLETKVSKCKVIIGGISEIEEKINNFLQTLNNVQDLSSSMTQQDFSCTVILTWK